MMDAVSRLFRKCVLLDAGKDDSKMEKLTGDEKLAKLNEWLKRNNFKELKVNSLIITRDEWCDVDDYGKNIGGTNYYYSKLIKTEDGKYYIVDCKQDKTMKDDFNLDYYESLDKMSFSRLKGIFEDSYVYD